MAAATLTVDSICEQFLPLAVRYAIPACERYPHLAAELKSEAAYRLFRAACGYLEKSDEFRARVAFPLWLKIVIVRACQCVITRERNQYPAGFLPQDDTERVPQIHRLHGRERPADEVLGDAEELWVEVEEVAGLMEQLSEADREMFLLHFRDEIPISHIAKQQGRAHSTTYARIWRALETVRRAAATVGKP